MLAREAIDLLYTVQGIMRSQAESGRDLTDDEHRQLYCCLQVFCLAPTDDNQHYITTFCRSIYLARSGNQNPAIQGILFRMECSLRLKHEALLCRTATYAAGDDFQQPVTGMHPC